MQFHRVGIIVHVLLVNVAESILEVCQQRRHDSSMLAIARNWCRQCWKTHSLTLDRRLDYPCVIRCACGITTGEGENRRVLDVCKFPKQLFVEEWLDKGDACSPQQQLFGVVVRQVVLTLAEKSAAAHSYLCGNMGCGMHVVWSPGVAVQVRRKFVSVFAQLQHHKL